MYIYIDIRSDPKYSEDKSVLRLRSVLNKRPEIEADGERSYKNASGFPWISVGIINCDSNGNYPSRFTQSETFANLVEFICSDDGSAENKKRYIDLACIIARELNWEAVDDPSGRVYHFPSELKV